MTSVSANTHSLPYDIEFRSMVDDGWYSSRIVSHADRLVVKLHGFPETNDDEVFLLSGFATVAHVDELVSRFRPISQQVQDNECARVSEGARVCASYAFRVDDIRYYDAIVETVVRKEHLFGNEEECKCRFLLCWQHGPKEGHVSAASIANICMIEPFEGIDSRLASFAKMVKEKIERSGVGQASSPDFINFPSSVKQCSSSQVKEAIEQTHTPLGRKEESGRLSNYNENNTQDMDFTIAGKMSQRSESNLQDVGGSFSAGKDMSFFSIGEKTRKYSTLSQEGGQVKEDNGQFLVGSSGGAKRISQRSDSNLQDIGGSFSTGKDISSSSIGETITKYSTLSQEGGQVNEEKGQFLDGSSGGPSGCEEPEDLDLPFVLVDNLEKDLSTSSITEFIQKHTSTSPEAYVFPGLSSELYTRGVIGTESGEELKQICNFLNNPDQIIMSSKGRPWVIHEQPPIRGVTSTPQEEITVQELKVVHRGDKEYKIAKNKRDLFLEFMKHQKGLHKRLSLREIEVLQEQENGQFLVGSFGVEEGSLLLPSSSCHEELEDQYFVLVDNLEKDISCSSMMELIQNHTSISSQAFICLSLSSESYTRGVIVIDSEEELKQICNFLNNPDQIVMSSKGRPWVIFEEPSKCQTSETTTEDVTSIHQEKITVEQLKLIRRGDQEYMSAKRKKELFLEFVEHQKLLHKRLQERMLELALEKTS